MDEAFVIDEARCKDVYHTACLAVDRARAGDTTNAENYLWEIAILLGLSEEEEEDQIMVSEIQKTTGDKFNLY